MRLNFERVQLHRLEFRGFYSNYRLEMAIALTIKSWNLSEDVKFKVE
jgi:hypothetical protein